MAIDWAVRPVSVGWGVGALVLGYVAMTVIRAPYLRRSATEPVRERRRYSLDRMLLALTAVGNLGLPLAAVFGGLRFADHRLPGWELALGVAVLAAGLWLFHRSHADLGANWSVQLELRTSHQLITRGVYARVRHPMYSALLLMGVAQLLLVPNWMAGPAGLMSMALLLVERLGREERMMVDAFGDGYRAYAQRTPRLLPLRWSGR